jgi:hypothetical protein
MSLSIKNLQKLLLKSSFMTDAVYYYDNQVLFINAISNKNGERLLVYVPSKYNIYITSKRDNFYEIDYLEVNEDGTIAGDYAGTDEEAVDKTYERLNLELSTAGKSSEKVISELEEQYNFPLSLKDIGQKDIRELRQIFRQLNRLKLCVKNVKYKVAVSYRNYLCRIRRDDTMEGFLIKGMRGSANNRLTISIDLESFYTHENIVYDVKLLRRGIYNVLSKNQLQHTRNLNRVLDQKNVLNVSSVGIQRRKNSYKLAIARIEVMLEKLDEAEDFYVEKIKEVNEKYVSESSYAGLHNDLARNKENKKYVNYLDDIAKAKKDINVLFSAIKEKYEDLSLKVDKICFDNTVMLSAIAQNFNLLGQI